MQNKQKYSSVYKKLSMVKRIISLYYLCFFIKTRCKVNSVLWRFNLLLLPLLVASISFLTPGCFIFIFLLSFNIIFHRFYYTAIMHIFVMWDKKKKVFYSILFYSQLFHSKIARSNFKHWILSDCEHGVICTEPKLSHINRFTIKALDCSSQTMDHWMQWQKILSPWGLLPEVKTLTFVAAHRVATGSRPATM